METNNGVNGQSDTSNTDNVRVRLDLDDDDFDSGGRSQEEQWRLEEKEMKAAAIHVAPRQPPIPHTKFASEGRFITKTERANWRTFDFLVKDLGIAVGPPTLLIAASYSGKSFLLQHLALCAVSGRKLLDCYEVKQGKVLHLDYEQGTDQSEVRYQRLMNGHGISDADLRKDALLFARPTMALDHPEAEKELVFLTHGYSLCIIDSYRAALGKTDENSSEARGPLTMLGNVSEQTKCVFIVIHHQGKADAPRGERTWGRGSSAIFDAAGTVFSLKADGDVYSLKQEKSRIGRFSGVAYTLEDTGEMVESIGLKEGIRLSLAGGGATVEEVQLQKDKQIIIATLQKNGGALPAKQLEKLSGLPRARNDAARDALEREDVVKPEPDPRDKRYKVYRLSDSWKAKLEAVGGAEYLDA